MIKILILCTGNSCRSQMAHGYLKSLDSRLQVFSAGTKPAQSVHPLAVRTMAEADIDISGHSPKHVNKYLKDEFDFLITVCQGAKESCPSFYGKVKARHHIGFDDPAEARGSDEEIASEFRKIRDQIIKEFGVFYQKEILSKL